MLRRVALVRTDVSEERNASLMRVKRIGELGTTLAASINRSTLQTKFFITLMMEDIHSSDTSLHARAKRCNIPEDGIFHYS
jgi:hypothetical protein